MGHKINPYGFRLGITTDWKARWFAEGQAFKDNLHSDVKIREYIKNRLRHASISRIEIERKGDRLHVVIHTARPGVVIGRKGSEVEALKLELVKMSGMTDVRVDAMEISDPQKNAQVVAQQIAEALQGRVMFRRAMKRAVGDAMRAGAKGVKVQCSGRLGGAEMSRREYQRDGQVPLTTLRADLDYGFYEARTKSGVIGVKVWIYHGEVLPEKEEAKKREAALKRMSRRPASRPRRQATGPDSATDSGGAAEAAPKASKPRASRPKTKPAEAAPAAEEAAKPAAEEAAKPVAETATATEVESPKAVETQAEEAKVEAPKVEEAKVEEAKAEEAKVEAPKAEVVEAKPEVAPEPEAAAAESEEVKPEQASE